MNVATWSDENLARFGDYDAVVAGDRVWSKRQVHDAACRLAAGLIAQGLRPGDRVLLLLPNAVEMVAAFAAVVRSGGVAVPLFAGASAREIERIAALSSPAAIVTTAALVPKVQAASKTAGIKVAAGEAGTPAGWIDYASLVREHEPLAAAVPRDAGDAAVICYTSGTSGAPKGVVHTHGSVHARHAGGTRRLPARILVALPLGTLGASNLTGHFAHQWTLILQDTFEPRAFLSAIERYRVSKLVLVPSMGEALAALPDLARYDLSSLRSVGFTGADVPAALIAKLASFLPVNPSVAYGMTETGGGVAASGLGSKPGSVGRILKGVEVRIVGEDGTSLPNGEVGEIHVRTPWMGSGYYQQPDETAATFSDGWIRTGDLGYVDEDGELFLVGRSKDLIVQGGVKVAPRDVADVIRRLPGVDECAVVGVPHAVLGEQVVACVVRGTGSTLTDREVLAHCRTLLDPRKVPVRVRLCGDLPRTPNRKVNVQALREQLMGEQAAVVETEVVRRLRAATGSERTALLRALVQEEVLRILPAQRSGSSTVASSATFGELGLDSLRLAQLGHALGDALGRAVRPTVFFSHPTIDALSRHLVAEIVEPAGPAAARARTRTAVREPVAIVGFGCRLPGRVYTPEEYWSLLRDGLDATAEITRWNMDGLYDPARGTPGKTCTRRAALLDAPDHFDAEFFGVTTREAVRLDPQHRITLEVTWEAIEHAGYDPTGLSETVAGLFLGISAASSVSGGGLGAAPSMAVGRLCHFLDLRGPAVAVDTSCSSSLAAIHHAVQSLRLGECDVAIAGGVQLVASPRSFVGLSEMGLMAADGRCKAFDASADGFGRGEGCVMIVLKRLSDAEADRDRIIAVIRGSAARHDGRSSSLTAPNGRAQQDVMRAALEDAAVEPAAVTYLEAHGTGTPLGDPIEIEAALAVLGDPSRRLVVGSVKSNIGHLETAAGAAGLMKVALALERGAVPAHLHCRTLNPLLEPLSPGFVIPAATAPWPESPAGRRIASVTSMGLSGTNVHVVVEDAPPAATLPEDGRLQLLCLSARTDEALREQARRYTRHFASVEPAALAHHCFTANAGRAHFARRLALTARTASEIREQLEAWLGETTTRGTVASGTGASGVAASGTAANDAPDGVEVSAVPVGGVQTRAARGDTARCGAAQAGAGEARAVHAGSGGTRARVAFVFSGAELKDASASRALYESEPAFRRALHRCAEILQPLVPEPLVAVLYASRPSAVGRGPSRVGGRPSAVGDRQSAVGDWQSAVGNRESAEPGVAGAGTSRAPDLPTPDRRRPTPDRGLPPFAILALEWSLAELWRSWGIEPDVVAGDGIGELAAACVSGAITLEDGLKQAVASGTDDLAQAVARSSAPAAHGCDLCIHIGPRTRSSASGRNDVSAGDERDERDRMLETLAELYVRGVTPDWQRFYAGSPMHRVALPTYPFQRLRYRYRVADARETDEATATPTAPKPTALRTRLQAEASDRRRDELVAIVRDQVADLVGQAPESISPDDNCLELGLDSLGVLDVVTSIRQRTGIACTPSDFVSRATIDAFATFVSARLAAQPAAALSEPVPSDAAVSHLSDHGRRPTPDSLRTAAQPAAALSEAPSNAAVSNRDDYGLRPTPDGLRNAAQSDAASQTSSQLVVLNPRGPRAPIFCMHPSGGQVTAYLRLRTLLGDEHPLYAIQSRALADPDHEHASIESMAGEYATLVQEARPDGPYRLIGWSMGGLIALAVASVLERRGAPVEMVGLIDVIHPIALARTSPADELAFAVSAISADVLPSGEFTLTIADYLEDVQAVPPGELLAWCEARGRIPAGALTRDAFDRMIRLYTRHFQLVREYRPAVVDAPILGWRAASQRRPYQWAKQSRAGAVERCIGGAHFSVMQPPCIGLIAGDLALDRTPSVAGAVAVP